MSEFPCILRIDFLIMKPSVPWFYPLAHRFHGRARVGVPFDARALAQAVCQLRGGSVFERLRHRLALHQPQEIQPLCRLTRLHRHRSLVHQV